jgi:hypothetical protein
MNSIRIRLTSLNSYGLIISILSLLYMNHLIQITFIYLAIYSGVCPYFTEK